VSHAKVLRNKSESLFDSRSVFLALRQTSSSCRLLPKAAFFFFLSFFINTTLHECNVFYDVGTWHTMRHLCRSADFPFHFKGKRTISESLIYFFLLFRAFISLLLSNIVMSNSLFFSSFFFLHSMHTLYTREKETQINLNSYMLIGQNRLHRKVKKIVFEFQIE
jgi:hypothetical protein